MRIAERDPYDVDDIVNDIVQAHCRDKDNLQSPGNLPLPLSASPKNHLLLNPYGEASDLETFGVLPSRDKGKRKAGYTDPKPGKRLRINKGCSATRPPQRNETPGPSNRRNAPALYYGAATNETENDSPTVYTEDKGKGKMPNPQETVASLVQPAPLIPVPDDAEFKVAADKYKEQTMKTKYACPDV
ncbi:MAG: hypothetical protein Q9185_006828 [Variospora sp. 1 TL-2023]